MQVTTKVESFSNTVRIFLIRHGQSTSNVSKCFQGSSDESVLTDKGIEDAFQTGVSLRNLIFSTIYVSPLQRTKLTANSFLLGMGASIENSPTVQYHEALREIDLPNWQGLSYQYVRDNFPEDYQTWKDNPHQFQISVSEVDSLSCGTAAVATNLTTAYPVLNLQERVRQFLQDILPHHVGETIAIVSHGGTIRALMMELLGIPSPRFHALQQSNCGVNQLLVSLPESMPSCQNANAFRSNAILQQMNRTTHLGEKLPKLKEGKQGLRLLLVVAELETQTQDLVQQLKTIDIDFCLSINEVNAQRVSHEILQGHSTVQLQVCRQNFVSVWQQQISIRQLTQSLSQLRPTTGVVVASADVIHQMITQTLGLPEVQKESFMLDLNKISIIHYPFSSLTPVLQAFNFG